MARRTNENGTKVGVSAVGMNQETLSLDEPVCATCGTAFPAGVDVPAICPICEDERQYVPRGGQAWTSAEALRARYRLRRTEIEPGLHEIVVEPECAIGQRAFLICTEEGNVLWDCLPMVDAETIQWIEELGGLAAIAVSHPHFYGDFPTWSAAFGDVPIHLHAADAEWVQHPCAALHHWTGETLDILPGLRMIRCGGHFEGACVLHWNKGQGVLLSSDTISVSADRQTVSFMRSYPNRIPLGPSAVRAVVAAVAPYPIERLHGATSGGSIPGEARAAIEYSATRYLRAIEATE
ncbi:hypothetical protein [uncultured Tateyamaria sp.]|uniref:hypothetical protein n=1 Tax=uncultured Tateyamaria sp. TaxID=455651 RepID=UPI0026339D39|nr:hypothetical protein [uncultured Tateyamaria sp.]